MKQTADEGYRQYCFQETFRSPLSRLASVIYHLKSDKGKPMHLALYRCSKNYFYLFFKSVDK